jgi:hypothetical protein
MKPARLLRWYPRAWRERYGQELLALIQDTLDDGRPTWRLRLGVIWGGLLERGHQARSRAVKWLTKPNQPTTMVVAGMMVALLPANVMTLPSPPRGSQVAALVALLAAVSLTAAVVAADGLAALPALVRFLRAGGWPKIRRRVAWAGGATAVAGGALAGLVLAFGSRSATQLNASWGYLAAWLATGTAMAIAIALWATAATGTAKHLTRAPRVRAVQLLLSAVAGIMVTVVLATLNFWWSVTQAPPWLAVGLVWLALASVDAWRRIPQAVRRGRRLRAVASGMTIVNPSARRTHGRHRL